MLSEFERQIMSTIERNSKNIGGTSISRSPQNIDKTSITVDIDSETQLGRITCWDTGEVQQEVIDLSTGKTTLDRYTIATNMDEFQKVLDDFFSHL